MQWVEEVGAAGAGLARFWRLWGKIMSMFIDFPETHAKVQGMETMPIPRMVTIHQKYDDQKITDTAGHIRAQLEAMPDHESYKDKRICITVGSRGIPDLDVMVRAMCDVLKEWGAKPFIIPAMGSHGIHGSGTVRRTGWHSALLR